MFYTVEMDTVVIAIPPSSYCGQVEYAAEKGIHLFFEKPIALDLNRAKNMQKTVDDQGVISMVVYYMRFGRAFQKLKKMIEACYNCVNAMKQSPILMLIDMDALAEG